MQLIVVVGARPNFIKVGPLMPALAAAVAEEIDSGMRKLVLAKSPLA